MDLIGQVAVTPGEAVIGIPIAGGALVAVPELERAAVAGVQKGARVEAGGELGGPGQLRVRSPPGQGDRGGEPIAVARGLGVRALLRGRRA